VHSYDISITTPDNAVELAANNPQTVVCDSGDFATIDKYKPQDATTNPSLILAASKKAEYAKLIDAAVAWGKKHGNNIEDQVDATLDNLLVQFGKEILNVVPGKVSTEVDARFSFDTKASVNKALRIIDVCNICRRIVNS
jgi:transaldolase